VFFAVGQGRYATDADPYKFIQPVVNDTDKGDYVYATNGHRTFAPGFAEYQDYDGKPSDSYRQVQLTTDLMETDGLSALGALISSQQFSHGAYSSAVMHNRTMFAMRDPHGVRPLSMAPLEDYGYVIASEEPALVSAGIDTLKDKIIEVNPGELVTIDDSGVSSFIFGSAELARCSFESVYFASPDHQDTTEKRFESGIFLAQQETHDFDPENTIVVPMLDSAKWGAMGYASALDLPYVEAIVKVKKIRNYLQPDGERNLAINRKYAIDREAIRGKKVIILDDSRVEGLSLDYIRNELLEDLPSEIHIRILSPEITGGCNLGVVMSKERNIANKMSLEEYRQMIRVDSIIHLNLKSHRKAHGPDICDGCFRGGKYPSTRVEFNEKSIKIGTPDTSI